MAIHMSIRLAWHNEGWNGHFCKKPSENSYCVGQHSYPGNLIAGSRNLEFETKCAGKPCAAYPCAAACGLSVNAFGQETIKTFVDPPSFWNVGEAEGVMLTLPPYTACTWCYEEMYNDEVKIRGNGKQRYDYAKRKKGAEKYFAQFEPGKSLVFYYAGYSNPFCENEQNNYVIVGISRIKEIGPLYHYNKTSENVKRKYAGGFVWQRPVTSTYPDEGFRIPYWKYMDDEDVLEKLVIKPANRNPFKYGSREVTNDDAIEVINQMLAVVDTLIDLGDDSEDWKVRKAWLGSVLNELWTARGPYPGFPSVLECLKLHSLIQPYVALSTDDSMKNFRNQVHELLEGKTDSVDNLTFTKAELKNIRREYKLMGQETSVFLMDILARFDLNVGQMKAIIDEGREKVSITSSISNLKDNPYIIFEQYVGYDSDDTIPFYRIDNGVIPSPEYGIEALMDPGATERLRAFCIDELKRIAAHSFGKAEMILLSVNNRIERFPEWKQYRFRMQNLDVEREILDEAIVQQMDAEGNIYLYLKDVYEDERTVERVFRKLADRPDIQLKMAITPAIFKKGLRKRGSFIEKEAPSQYEEILGNQAEICMQIFSKPISILSGAAGTGKTTVIETILDNIERVHGRGTSFLLMAPTGKAAERIKAQTHKPSSTIHSFLAKNGWINANLTLKRSGGSRSQDVNTIIIDECSMIDLNLFATLFRAINWNSVQRLILVGDPNQLPPIGRGRVFSDVIEWLKEEYPENVGVLTDNIRQLDNTLRKSGNGILKLANVFIQEHLQCEDSNEAAILKAQKEEMFEQVLENGNGDIDKDLAVYFWNEQEELESVLTNVMIKDMQIATGTESIVGANSIEKLWQRTIKGEDGESNPDMIQVISPYRGEYYGTGSLNLLMQKTFNKKWSSDLLDGIGYFDKVIQFRNRPQSDPAYAYEKQFPERTFKKDIYNGEIGLSVIHYTDAVSNNGKEARYKNQENIERLAVAFSGENRKGFRYCFGSKLGKDADNKWIPDQDVIDNLELAYAISVHKSQGSEFNYVYIVIPHRDSHLLSMELLYTAITRAQTKVTLFLQQDIGTLTTLSNAEKSAVRKINSSVFRFAPLPDDLLYENTKWYESGKKISTLSEYFVRSKSEAIIVNMLVDRDIPFKYEEPLHADDGTMYLPDFTVTFNGEDYYWEHVGRTHDKSYMKHWEKKKQWYQKNFPGRLLETYEGNDLTRDALAIIEKYM